MVLFVWYYRWRQRSGRRLLLLPYSQYTQSIYLLGDEILCIFDTGKARPWCVFDSFIERRPAYFSSHLRCIKRQLILNEEAAVIDGLHLDACNGVWQLTGDLLFVLIIQVALLACVLIGSLAQLSFSFCKWSLLASCRWMMLSLAMWSHPWLLLGFKSPLQYLTLSWLSTKNEVMLRLTILVVLDCIMFWIKPFAYRVCRTQPLQVLDRTFCYQSLNVLNCIRFWIELLLSESCLTQRHQVLSRPFAIGAV
jgi:hypothetical protein